MKYVFIVAISILYFACSAPKAEHISQTEPQKEKVSQRDIDSSLEKVVKTPEEWKAELDEMEYYVLREKGTERSFTGDLWDNKEKGIYTCRGCQLPLFDSNTKFKSGTGWPSYYKPIKDGHVAEKKDFTHGMTRVEVLCGRCDGHLGHVFEDGPRPTGLRYCINSASLDFVRDSL